MAHLRKPYLPCLSEKLKYFWLSSREESWPDSPVNGCRKSESESCSVLSDSAIPWTIWSTEFTVGKKISTHPLWSLTEIRIYLQSLSLLFFNFTSLPSSVCSIKETSIQTQAQWFFDTSPPSFQWARFLNRVSIPCPNNRIYWPVMLQEVWFWTQ